MSIDIRDTDSQPTPMPTFWGAVCVEYNDLAESSRLPSHLRLQLYARTYLVIRVAEFEKLRHGFHAVRSAQLTPSRAVVYFPVPSPLPQPSSRSCSVQVCGSEF